MTEAWGALRGCWHRNVLVLVFDLIVYMMISFEVIDGEMSCRQNHFHNLVGSGFAQEPIQCCSHVVWVSRTVGEGIFQFFADMNLGILFMLKTLRDISVIIKCWNTKNLFIDIKIKDKPCQKFRNEVYKLQICVGSHVYREMLLQPHCVQWE